MLSYEEFKSILENKFLDYMPEEFADHKVVIREATKINHKADVLELMPQGDRSGRYIPSMKVADMYGYYTSHENLEIALQTVARELLLTYKDRPLYDITKLSREEFLRNVVMVLINTEQNKELLESVPHREFRDLSVTYRIPVETNGDYFGTAWVSNTWVERLNIRENELYEAAVKNTRRLYPPMISTMNNVLAMAGMDVGQLYRDEEAYNFANNMYVIKNHANFYGANAMLYEDILHNLAQKMDSDLYIIPSSVHELIAVSAELVDLSDIARTVKAINATELLPEDKLSDNVYHYDKRLREITIASVTPIKEVDRAFMEESENKRRMEVEETSWRRNARI